MITNIQIKVSLLSYSFNNSWSIKCIPTPGPTRFIRVKRVPIFLMPSTCSLR
uniref:Uncharacterized protein n=1 Tax=Lepeophtheirus salmonis TaxID=72036 RepID=A0A0K2V2A1_LEPSM